MTERSIMSHVKVVAIIVVLDGMAYPELRLLTTALSLFLAQILTFLLSIISLKQQIFG
jgi:hypothetical protein